MNHLFPTSNIGDPSPTRQEQLSLLMDNSTHFIFHYLGRRRGQGRILRLLNEYGELTQQELQGKLNIQSGSLSEGLAKMEVSGLITRERDESDKRRVIVRITEKGLEEHRRHEEIRMKRQAVLYDSLEPKEQDELIRLLTKLQTTWETLPPQCEQYHSCHQKGETTS